MVETKTSVYDITDDAESASLLTTTGSGANDDHAEVPEVAAAVVVFDEKTTDGVAATVLPEATLGTSNNNNDDEASDKDPREVVLVAGIGSAMVGMMLCGPILAVVFGCSAAYAAETNAEIRYKVQTAWEKTQQFNEKHRIVERGVNGIGKRVYWLIEKIGGYRKTEEQEQQTNTETTKSVVS